MKIRRLIPILGAVLAAALVPAWTALPAAAVDKAGDVVSVRGKAVIERKAGNEDARVRAALMESDNIVTRDRSRIKMLFRDDSILTLGANSKLVIRKYLYNPQSKRGAAVAGHRTGRAAERPVRLPVNEGRETVGRVGRRPADAGVRRVARPG